MRNTKDEKRKMRNTKDEKSKAGKRNLEQSELLLHMIQENRGCWSILRVFMSWITCG